MNSKNLYFVFPFLAVALVASGCGKDRTGDYKGNETVSQASSAVTTTGGTTQAPQSYAQSYQVTLKITDNSNDTLTGTYQSSVGTGTFTGKVSDDGNQIQNVVLSMPQPASSSTVNGVSTSGCGGTFTGSLTLGDNTITGNLTLSGVTAPTAGTTATSYCSGMSRNITLTK